MCKKKKKKKPLKTMLQSPACTPGGGGHRTWGRGCLRLPPAHEKCPQHPSPCEGLPSSCQPHAPSQVDATPDHKARLSPLPGWGGEEVSVASPWCLAQLLARHTKWMLQGVEKGRHGEKVQQKPHPSLGGASNSLTKAFCLSPSCKSNKLLVFLARRTGDRGAC